MGNKESKVENENNNIPTLPTQRIFNKSTIGNEDEESKVENENNNLVTLPTQRIFNKSTIGNEDEESKEENRNNNEPTGSILKENFEISSIAIEKLLSINDKITQIQQENAKLIQEIEEKAQSANAKIQKWKLQYFKGHTDMIPEQQKLYELEIAKGNFVKEIQLLREEIESNKKKLHEAVVENGKLNLENKEKNTKLEKLEEDIYDLNQTIKNRAEMMKVQLSELRMKVIELERKKCECLDNNNSQESELIKTKEKLIESQKKNSEIILLKNSEIEKMQKDILTLTNTNKNMETKYNALDNELTRSKKSLSNQQKQLIKLNEHLLNSKNRSRREIMNLKLTIGDKTSKLEASEAEVYSLNNKIAEFDYSLNKGQKSKSKLEDLKTYNITELREIICDALKQIDLNNEIETK